MAGRIRVVGLIVLGLVVSASMMLACLAGGCLFGNDCSGVEQVCEPGEVVSPYGGCQKAPSPRDAGCSGDDCRG
jgi:hypothetical protein